MGVDHPPVDDTAVGVEDVVVEGFPGLRLRHGVTDATFVPDLGLLGTSLRHRGGEYLDLTGGASRVRTGHTTGLPLLAPWANRLRGDAYRVGRRRVDLADAPGLHRDAIGLPIHGTMVGRPGWVVARRGVTRSGAARFVAVVDAAADAEVMASFPFPHRLEVTVALRPGRLEITTAVVATGRSSVPVSFGWHPYLTVPDVAFDDLRLTLPPRAELDLDGRMLPTGVEQRRPPSRARLPALGLDDAFSLRDRQRAFTLAGPRRSVTMTPGSGYRFGQVYAPAGSTVVALEPMVAAIDALGAGTAPVVAPGDRYAARFRLDLR